MITDAPTPRARQRFAVRMPRSTVCVRSRGTAMSEMVLVLPLILFVLVMLLFFGRGMVRVQHALVMDRYATWRQVYASPGPAWTLEQGTDAYNQTFFGGKAQSIGRDLSDELPNDAERELSQLIGDVHPEAQIMVDEVHETLPGGLTTRFRTLHANTQKVYEPFVRPVRHAHTRLAGDWKFVNSFRDMTDRGWRDFENDPVTHAWPPENAVMGQWQPWPSHGAWWPRGLPVSLLLAVREALFDDLDTALENIQNNDNPLAAELRNVLVREPGYGGPTVLFAADDATPAQPQP